MAAHEAPGEDLWVGSLTLPDGTHVHFRHVHPSDEPLISKAYASASRQTLLHRFFSPIRSLAPDQLRRMLNFDRRREVCIVGCIQQQNQPRIICGARYVRLAEPESAEIALTVHDDFHHLGLGTYMLVLLAQLAAEDGIHRFHADVMSSNLPMLQLVRKIFPAHTVTHTSGDVLHLQMEINPVARDATHE